MIDLKQIKKQYEFDAKRFSKMPEKILKQSFEYHRHLETGFLIDKLDALEKELIGK